MNDALEQRIRFGPAGLGSPQIAGLDACAKAGLRTAEVAFTYGVRMSCEAAEKLGARARELDIMLSIHAPYYINLASIDDEKRRASRQRIIDSCERAHYMGAARVVFHAGFYQDRNPGDIFNTIRDELIHLNSIIKQKGWHKVMLCPETTGKPSQFAGLKELLELARVVPCGICVDFAHLYARNQGKVDYQQVLKQLAHFSHIHGHFSGISYTGKGEQRHKNLRRTFFEPLAQALRDIPAHQTVTLISESPPNPLRSAVNMKKWLFPAFS